MSTLTTVVNIHRDAYDFYGGRTASDPRTTPLGVPGFLGNPFLIGPDGNRSTVIEKFTTYFLYRLEHDEAFKQAVLALKGKRLACFCRPSKPCHLDAVAAWLNEQPGTV